VTIWTIPTLSIYRRDVNRTDELPWAFKRPSGFWLDFVSLRLGDLRQITISLAMTSIVSSGAKDM
jgi:hypothetical protein